MYDAILTFVTILIIIGIVKDIFVFTSWLDKWLAVKNNGKKASITFEKADSLFAEKFNLQNEVVSSMLDKHIGALLAENKKTNDLLTRFLFFQKVIAKNVHGLDLDV